MNRILHWAGGVFFNAVLAVIAFGIVMPQISQAAQPAPHGCEGWYGNNAGPYNGCWRGYFKNGYIQWGDEVINGGIGGIGTDDKEPFITKIESYLDGSYTVNASLDKSPAMIAHLKTSAEFIILSMSGYNAGVAKSVSGPQLANWEARIRNPAVSLVVHDMNFDCNIANSFYQSAPMDDIAAGYSDTPDCNNLNTMIDFYVGGSLVYRIRVACGNPLGNLPGLPNPPPPTVPVCGIKTIVPMGTPEINDQFKVVATITFSGGPNPPTGITGQYMSVGPSPGNIPFGAPVLSGTYVGGYTYTFTSGLISEATPGTYVVSWGGKINDAPMLDCGGAGNVGAKFNVLAHPYFEVNGGDVDAGSGFAASNPLGTTSTACPAPTNPKAGITSWNKSGTPDFSGANTEYGDFALSLIHGFATNFGNNPSPTSLSFSNKQGAGGGGTTIDTPNSLFGGYFGKPPCVDYWNTKPPVGFMLSLPGIPGILNTGSITTNGNYWRNGPLVILPGTNTVSLGKRATVYVNGDVYITGDIKYQNSGSSWATEAEIPSFRMVVHGRIFIDSGVSNIDGTYVAIPNTGYNLAPPADTYSNPLAGTIVTCTNGPFTYDPLTAPGAAGLTSNCDNNTLTVNGSLVANHIYFLRTRGSVNTATPAEVINYTPEVWMAPPAGAVVDSSYQAIAGLPPVL